VYANQLTLSIPGPGRWRVEGVCTVFNNGAVTATPLRAGISLTTGNVAPPVEINDYDVGTTQYRYGMTPLPLIVDTKTAVDVYFKFRADIVVANLVVQSDMLATRIA
jgi:hypothetical protein